LQLEGTIGHRIEKSGLTESEVKEFTESILKGLQFIHDKGYVHCDLKPDNILLVPDMTSHADFVAKIADFGLTKRAQDMYSRQGTAIYWPPETVLSNIQGKPSDIWALGCVVLEMLTGNLWPCKTSEDLSSWVSNPIIPSHLSKEAKDFLSKCLDINASTRFTAERLLTHSFLRKPSNECVEQVAKVSTLSQSKYYHHRLPSFIPIGDWSSVEAQKTEDIVVYLMMTTFFLWHSCQELQDLWLQTHGAQNQQLLLYWVLRNLMKF
jgi:serine/threonine protein kinase